MAEEKGKKNVIDQAGRVVGEAVGTTIGLYAVAWAEVVNLRVACEVEPRGPPTFRPTETHGEPKRNGSPR
jgi:hypothetical protein